MSSDARTALLCREGVEPCRHARSRGRQGMQSTHNSARTSLQTRCGLILVLAMLAGCRPAPHAAPGAPAGSGPLKPQPCDLVDREVGARETARICVRIGRGNVVRLLSRETDTADTRAVVCNTSDVPRAWIAWASPDASLQRGLAPETVWARAKANRRALGAHSCAGLPPTSGVVLRGWYDGGQGYDVAAEWEATVTFRPSDAGSDLNTSR